MSFATGLKTIVMATDLSGRSEAALEYVRKLASGYGARIVLAHGLDPLDYAAVESIPAPVLEELTAQARAALDALASDLLAEGIHSHSEIRQGQVAQMLVDVARQYGAGLIVVGTRGMQGAGPLVVGSLVEQMVRLSPCPVLAVAADWNAGPYRPTPGGSVLLALERNEATGAAAATAISLAERFKRSLVVVHARGGAESAAILNPGATTLEDFGVKASGSCPVRFVVKDGGPVDAVESAIGQFHPAILVLGVKRASGTPGPHGTAFGLLARSRVPVLCVPPEPAAADAESEACVVSEAK